MPGQVIIVTGASRGIGLAICQHLLQPLQGCNVVAIARSREPLEEISKAHEGRVIALPGDVANPSLAEKAVQLAMEKWGRLDGLIINHGTVEPVQRLIDADLDKWKSAFDGTVFGTVALIKATLPELRKSKGRIVMTSSGAAVKGYAAWGCYGAGKAVLNSLALTLANEEPDVTTMAIRPAIVDTEMQTWLSDQGYPSMDPKDAEKYSTMKKNGTMLKPQQPGNVMARLVLNAPKDMSGRFVDWNDQSLAKFQDI